MNEQFALSRRSFLSLIAVAPLGVATTTPAADHIPIGLELYSVRGALQKDLSGTVRAVAKMGYDCVEFFSPYYRWTQDEAKQVRRELDDLGIHCYSTHNDLESFSPTGIGKAIDLNHILGARYIVLASAGDLSSIDAWKRVAETLNKADETMAGQGLHAGYHNHDVEWRPVEGQKPLEVIAANTAKSIMLQLDVGTCLEAGSDPVAWIESNPGRIRSLHLKEWSPEKGYKVLFGEGVAPWKKLLAAAESTGGVEFYLIEQEGSDYPELETAERCLAAFRKVHA
ncbi:MAG TPA: sugar phosphate isomerase/epimerase family protein [Terriglobia bacterium]|nr:sugar phosphate isomerase/epimerase family protein [Terriglobia bacterium]